jgi:parvulin-like peptidyl-prolyl isomerase
MLRACLLVTLPAMAICATEVREEILVVVNNHILTRRVFQQEVEQAGAALYRQFSGKELDDKLRDAREQVLQTLIDSFLLQDKSVDLGIQVTDEHLAQIVESIKRDNQFQSDADMEQALRTSLGIGMKEYLKRTKEKMLQQEVLRQEVFSRVAIEDQELRASTKTTRTSTGSPAASASGNWSSPGAPPPRSSRPPRPSSTGSWTRSSPAGLSRTW